jgi:hypothetical protein
MTKTIMSILKLMRVRIERIVDKVRQVDLKTMKGQAIVMLSTIEH